jgi:hypothetical protein
MKTMDDFISNLAINHEIFVQIEVRMVGFHLEFAWIVVEPLYDRMFGYNECVKRHGEAVFDSYEEALSDAVEYVIKNARRAANGMLTLKEEYQID